MLTYFGGCEHDGRCLFDRCKSTSDMAQTSIDAIERCRVVRDPLTRRRQVGNGIVQEAKLMPHGLESLGSGYFGVDGICHERQAKPCSVRNTRGWNIAGSREIFDPFGVPATETA